MLVMALACATALPAAEFAPPAEGPVPFRRDRMPLDVSTMAGLSRDLATLAAGTAGKTPQERRAAAQLLALALAVDPGNEAARRLLGDFSSSKRKVSRDAAAVAASRGRIAGIAAWLREPAAGADGRALADCLDDVTAAMDGADREETGAWAGWIPESAAFENEPPPAPEPAAPPAADPVKLKSATLITVTEHIRPTAPFEDGSMPRPGVPTLTAARVQMTVTTGGSGKSPPSIHSGTTALTGTAALLRLLQARQPDLPGRCTFAFEIQRSPRSPETARPALNNAPAAVMMLAAFSGNAPADSTLIVGNVDAAGNLTLPKMFWETLRCIDARGAEGGRLILPAAAAGYLPALLTLEKPGFFLKYEVALARNLDEAVAYSAGEPDPMLAAIFTRFAEIQDKASGQQVGSFVANHHVRRRLEEISRQAPWHASARMLAVQGAGERSSRLPKEVLAPEILRIMARTDSLATVGSDGGSIGSVPAAMLTSLFNTCGDELAKLKRYAAREDFPLFASSETVVAAIRTVERTTKGLDGYEKSYIEAGNAWQALRQAHAAMRAELTQAVNAQ